MDAMQVKVFATAHDQVTDRRDKLQAAIGALGPRPELTGLLAEVDAALERLARGTYGLCETCHDPIEPDRLIADPITRFCLDHLSRSEQRALEQDLQLAARVQRGLLPNPACAPPAWDVAYHYEPARVVSGDYCDLLVVDGDLYFMLGDVSGKGVAAATLMAQLHAMLRALVPTRLPVDELVTRVSRLFCESTLPMHYATMVCGRATSEGDVEVCNAGHLPVFVAEAQGVRALGATGLPMGLFCEQTFSVERLRLSPGDGLLLVTDGVSEAESPDGLPFGLDRLAGTLHDRRAMAAGSLVAACLADLRAHAGARPCDDTSMLAVRYR
ncbi:MAG: SpoIIE family protein phosphatase [Vicinamibacterales bacterium]